MKWVKLPLSDTGVLAGVSVTMLLIQLHAKWFGKVADMVQVLRALPTHMGDQDEVPGSWLQPNLDLSDVTFCWVSHWIKDLFLSPSLSPPCTNLSIILSSKQIDSFLKIKAIVTFIHNSIIFLRKFQFMCYFQQ